MLPLLCSSLAYPLRVLDICVPAVSRLTDLLREGLPCCARADLLRERLWRVLMRKLPTCVNSMVSSSKVLSPCIESMGSSANSGPHDCGRRNGLCVGRYNALWAVLDGLAAAEEGRGWCGCLASLPDIGSCGLVGGKRPPAGYAKDSVGAAVPSPCSGS